MSQSQNEQYLFETLIDHGSGEAAPSIGAAELSEAEVAEVASQLLSAETETEIDRLLPRMLPPRKLAAAGLTRLATRPAPRAAALRTGKLVKRVTRAVLANLRRALAVVPDEYTEDEQFLGDVVGGLGSLFGGEVSEPRELELEVAKKLVRFGNGAMCRALLAGRHQPPAAAARTAVVSAAKEHAPGLLRTPTGCPVCSAAPSPATHSASPGHLAFPGHVASHGHAMSSGHAPAAAARRMSGRWVRRPTGILLTA